MLQFYLFPHRNIQAFTFHFFQSSTPPVRRNLFSYKREREDEDETSPVKRQRQQMADDIMGAVEKLQANEENLVGDGSRIHSLPTVNTRNHRDLKTVTPSTVSNSLVVINFNISRL